MSTSPWYHTGLRFNCTGCGACCMGAGRVWVSLEDLESLSQYLGLDVAECVHQYVERVSGRWALKENSQKGQCVFLNEQNQCKVYEGRPHQCRSFPWWPTVLESTERWAETARTCEGIDHADAPVIPFATIQNQLHIEKQKRKKRS